MSSFRTRTVDALVSQRRGLQRVRLDDGSRAYVLTRLTGPVDVGDAVVVNTTAVELGLGTGGWHVVHWNLARDRWDEPGPGHVMKLRYTSLQVDAGSYEEHQAPPEELSGQPVVVCSLHSQVGVVVIALKHLAPACRIVYVMSDSAALALELSDLVYELTSRELLAATVTAGQAFGGDAEAVNAVSALTVAAALGADVIVVGPGIGTVGTATALGHGAVEVAAIANAAAALGGRPVVCVRYSSADARERHRGVSHHMGAIHRLLRDDIPLAVPSGEEPAGLPERPRLYATPPELGPLMAEPALAITSMGRGLADDSGFFRYAAAAGAAAATLLSDSLPRS